MLQAIEVIHTVHRSRILMIITLESNNKELKKHLITYCQDRSIRSYWSRVTPSVQYIINTTPNVSTGFTPFDLLIGPEMNPHRLRLSRLESANSLPKNKDTWWDEQSDQHKVILKQALALQGDLDAQHLEERSDIQSAFSVGNYILELIVLYPMDTMYYLLR